MSTTAIIGEGYLGGRFRQYFEAENIPEAEVDIRDLQSVRAALDAHPCDVLLNLAAATNTGALEKPENQDEGFRVNVQGLANLALACKERGIRLVHFSTGMMYDGTGPDGTGWKENTLPEPTNYYVWTKAWGDLMLERFAERDGILIVRLHLPVSAESHPKNLLNKMMGFDGAVDAESSMTVVEDLLRATKALVDQGKVGIYHVANPGMISFWHIMEIMKEEGLVPAEKPVKRITRDELDAMGGAKQAFPLLNTDKLQAAGVNLPQIEDAIRACVRSLKG